jgi:hypothetical protein
MGNQKKLLFLLGSVTLVATFNATHYEMLALQNNKKYSIPNTCSELQGQANRATWTYKTTFQGFEGLPIETNANLSNPGGSRLCQLGYITRISPMGKEICRGYIYTKVDSPKIRWGYGYYKKTIYQDSGKESDYCRYVN